MLKKSQVYIYTYYYPEYEFFDSLIFHYPLRYMLKKKTVTSVYKNWIWRVYRQKISPILPALVKKNIDEKIIYRLEYVIWTFRRRRYHKNIWLNIYTLTNQLK